MDGVALPPTLRITDAEEESATTRLVLSGELDCSSAHQLRSRIHEALVAGTTTLVLDLTGVSFIDAAGLGVFVGARRRLSERDGRLELVGTTRPVQRVLDITGLHILLQPSAAPSSGPIVASPGPPSATSAPREPASR